MSISHAPPAPSSPDISVKPDTSNRSPELEALAPSSARRTRVPRWLRRTSGPLLLLPVWQLLSSTGALTPEVLASPGTIARVGRDLLADGSLTGAMGVSLPPPSPTRRSPP